MQKRMRYLRLKHNISMPELSAHSTVSKQRLSQIELEEEAGSKQLTEMLEKTFYRMIENRRSRLAALEFDFNLHRKHLLDFVPKGEEIS